MGVGQGDSVWTQNKAQPGGQEQAEEDLGAIHAFIKVPCILLGLQLDCRRNHLPVVGDNH